MLYHALNDTISEIDRSARRWLTKAGLIALLVALLLALFIVPAHAGGSGINPVMRPPGADGNSGITPVTMAPPQPTDGAYALLDSTGKGTVHYPELEATSYTVCLPGFECLGGERQYTNDPYEILLYEDGSGWLSVSDSRTQFCLTDWPCDTNLPDPCDADTTAPECTPTEEPPILAPVCTDQWCGKLFLPAIIAQNATILGDGEGAGPICSRPDCTQ